MLNPEELSHNLLQSTAGTVTPDARRQATSYIHESMTQPNFGPLLLNLISNSPDQQITIAAAITFKNYVRTHWGSLDDGDNKIPIEDRETIKSGIVNIMLKSPVLLQKQLSVAITMIGQYDFPEKWTCLFDQLVEHLNSGDFNIINGVLSTAHSITKRYRYQSKSDKLWIEIKQVLDKFCKPLTDLFVKIVDLIQTHADDKTAVHILIDSLNLCSKIYYSLLYQDIPEELEDSLKIWMPRFQALLLFENKHIEDSALEAEPTSMENLKSKAFKNQKQYIYF